MLSKYYKKKNKYMKGGNKEELPLADIPPGGFDLKPIPQKHNSLSAAIQANIDQSQEAAELQQEINQRGAGYFPPGEAPPGKIEVEGSSVLSPEQNETLTLIRELQMQSQVDSSIDEPVSQTGGKRRKRKTKNKRWLPKNKKSRRKKKKGGEVHYSQPKLNPISKENIYNRYKYLKPINYSNIPPQWNKFSLKNALKQKTIAAQNKFLKSQLGNNYRHTTNISPRNKISGGKKRRNKRRKTRKKRKSRKRKTKKK